MLNPWRLKMLRELFVRGTIADVAAAVFVTPSAVSQQLSILEREVGIPLLERQGRRVALTPAAIRLVANADRILDEIDAAETEMAQLRTSVSGHVRLAAFSTVAVSIIPNAMVALRGLYPDLQLKLQDLEPHESITALRLGEIDLAIVDDFDIQPADLDSSLERRPLGSDVLCAALPTNHPLTKLREVELGDLVAEPWSMTNASTHYFRVIMESCHRAGAQPNIVAYCRDVYVQLALAEAGLSVAVLPRLAFTRSSCTVVSRVIKPTIRRHIYISYRRGSAAHPGIAAVVEEVERVARDVLEPDSSDALLSHAGVLVP